MRIYTALAVIAAFGGGYSICKAFNSTHSDAALQDAFRSGMFDGACAEARTHFPDQHFDACSGYIDKYATPHVTLMKAGVSYPVPTFQPITIKALPHDRKHNPNR